MAELETALGQLGGEVAFPPTPDLTSAIRGRLERPQPFWRRPIALVLAVVAVAAVAAAFAVPQSRSAILDWLGLRNVSVVRVEKLPTVPAGNLDLGKQVTLDEAKHRASWLRLPDSKPDSVWVSESIPGGKVSLLWGTPANVRLLLTEVSGRAYIEKIISAGTEVERVKIGNAGAWFHGPHVVMFQDREGRFHDSQARLAANTLVWQQGGVTLRLEGSLSKDEALRIARTAS